jgi:hypothetical protein
MALDSVLVAVSMTAISLLPFRLMSTAAPSGWTVSAIPPVSGTIVTKALLGKLNTDTPSA